MKSNQEEEEKEKRFGWKTVGLTMDGAMLLGIRRRVKGGIQRRNGFREWRALLIREERVHDVRGRGFIGGLGF